MSSTPLAVIRVLAVTVTLLLSGLSGGLAFGEETKEGETISLGIVSLVHRDEISKHFEDFADYVARKLHDDSKAAGKVVVVSTPQQLAELLRKGEVDFYMESSYPTYVINDTHGAGKLLLRRWKGGQSEYQSVIFTRKDGGIDSLEALRGKVIAFEDPGSTSGFFLPRSFLSRKGLELSKKDRPVKKVEPGEVGYIFAMSANGLLDLVLNEKAAAGAFSSDDLAALDDEKKGKIKILAETGMLPRHLLSVRTDLPPAVTERLEKVLLAMHEDAEGRTILKAADDTTKFDVLPGGEEKVRQLLLANFYLAVEE